MNELIDNLALIDKLHACLHLGLRFSKVMIVVTWESKELFTLESFWWDAHTIEVIDLGVNNSPLSHFTIIFTLEDFNPFIWSGYIVRGVVMYATQRMLWHF